MRFLLISTLTDGVRCEGSWPRLVEGKPPHSFALERRGLTSRKWSSTVQEAGYDFVALSDHNVLAEGSVSLSGSHDSGRLPARFGDDWVEVTEDGRVRLKTFEEYRSLFEEKSKFLLIQSEEITDHFEEKPLHVNATNVREVIEPQGGGSVREVLQRNVDAVLEQRARTGDLMFPVNHPNFGWAVKWRTLSRFGVRSSSRSTTDIPGP
jgi:hypothetical protein